jgi:hypothetical protein
MPQSTRGGVARRGFLRGAAAGAAALVTNPALAATVQQQASVPFGPAHAQDAGADVRRLMTAFITALQNLDFPGLRECWVDNPVQYGPSDAMRIEGSAFDSNWQMQFQQLRQAAAARGVTTAPYMKVDPQDMRVDFPSSTVAVVTFHLTDNSRLRRRMFVAARTASGWKLTHLNISDVRPR